MQVKVTVDTYTGLFFFFKWYWCFIGLLYGSSGLEMQFYTTLLHFTFGVG